MVLVLLALLCVQVGTGLCGNDEISVQGPLAEAVGPANSDWLSHIHAVNFRLIEAAIALHVLAILTYRVLRGHRLVWPMVTGNKPLPDTLPAPRMASAAKALGAVLRRGRLGRIRGAVVRRLTWRGAPVRSAPLRSAGPVGLVAGATGVADDLYLARHAVRVTRFGK